MKLVYEPGDVVALISVDELSAIDFGGEQTYNQLLDAQELQEEFKIIADTRGDGSYFDIECLTDGRRFAAISVYHLRPVKLPPPFDTFWARTR